MPQPRFAPGAVARRLLLGEHQRGLRLLHLRLAGGNLAPAAHVELRVDVLDAGFSAAATCASSLRECDAIVAIVDASDHVAGFDIARLSVTGTAVM